MKQGLGREVKQGRGEEGDETRAGRGEVKQGLGER